MGIMAAMSPVLLLSLGFVVIALALWVPRWRLKKAIEAPFPEEWVQMLERNIEVYPRLPMPLRLQLRKLIKQFLHQKTFTGAGVWRSPTRSGSPSPPRPAC